MAAEENVEFEWRTYESRVEDVFSALGDSGIEIERDNVLPAPPDDDDDAGFEPLLMIAGASAVALVARTVSRIVRDHTHGGVIIDMSGEPVVIRDGVRGLNAGTVVVVGKGEPKMLSSPDELAISKLLARQ